MSLSAVTLVRPRQNPRRQHGRSMEISRPQSKFGAERSASSFVRTNQCSVVWMSEWPVDSRTSCIVAFGLPLACFLQRSTILEGHEGIMTDRMVRPFFDLLGPSAQS